MTTDTPQVEQFLHEQNEKLLAENLRLQLENAKLTAVVQKLCADGSCCCDDWMANVPGELCVYCQGRAALEGQP